MRYESTAPLAFVTVEARIDAAPNEGAGGLVSLDDAELSDIAGGDRWGDESHGRCARSGIYMFCSR